MPDLTSKARTCRLTGFDMFVKSAEAPPAPEGELSADGPYHGGSKRKASKQVWSKLTSEQQAQYDRLADAANQERTSRNDDSDALSDSEEESPPCP